MYCCAVLKEQWKGQVRAETGSRLLVAYAFEVSINVQNDNVQSDRYDTQCILHDKHD